MIAIKYSLFAIISIMLNLGSQYIFLYFYQGYLALYIAIFIGISLGLISKYILDKKYIFYYVAMGKYDDGKKFLLYATIGGVLTIIFLVFELGFHYLFATEYAKYVGALIGISIGYTGKYFLDKRYVFNDI